MTYVTPSVGQPYQIGIKYGGEDIPGSPFEMSSNPDLDDVTGTGIPVQSSGKPGKRVFSLKNNCQKHLLWYMLISNGGSLLNLAAPKRKEPRLIL